MKVKILAVQSESIAGNLKRNIENVSTLLENSGHDSSDIIILPELWTTGWDCKNFNKYSQDLFHSDVYYFLKDLAKKYNSNVIGGSSIIKKQGEGDRNTCIIIDRGGNLIGTYDKYHLFSHRGESEGTYLEPGDTGIIVNTDIGRIGISICYDIRFPELFRLYAYKNADCIVNMAAWPKAFAEEYRILARARAIENQIFFISCCTTGKITELFDFSGNSFVSDYKGEIIASIGSEEGVLSSFIELDDMKNYRKQMPILEDRKSTYRLREF